MAFLKKIEPYKFEKVTDPKRLAVIAKDPYFVKKRKEAAEFFKKHPLPDSFKYKK
jgi:hypothetical protein